MTAALFTGCAKQPQAPDQPQEEAVTIRVGGLKGPTSMGLVKLLDDAETRKPPMPSTSGWLPAPTS